MGGYIIGRRVAKFEGDWWLSNREMGGYVVREIQWMAKLLGR
jgi:hypothetical protein